MVLLLFKLTSVGQTITVKEVDLLDSVKVGRSTSNFPCLPNNLSFNNQVLSRNHACIFQQDGKVFIKDTNSSNGTMVNGVSISPHRSHQSQLELKSGDIIQFGSDVCLDNGTYHYAVSGKIYYDFSRPEDTSTAYECDSVDTIEGMRNYSRDDQHDVETSANNEGTMVPSSKRNGYGRIKRILKHYESFEEAYSKKIVDLDKFVSDMKKSLESHYKLFYDQSLLISRIRSLEAQLAIYTSEYQGGSNIHDLVSYEKKISDIERRWKEDLLRLHYQSRFEVKGNEFRSSVQNAVESPIVEKFQPPSAQATSSCSHDLSNYTETEVYKLMLELHSRIKSFNNEIYGNGISERADANIDRLNISSHIQSIIDEIDHQTLSYTLRKEEGSKPDDHEDSGLSELPSKKNQVGSYNGRMVSVAIFSIGLISGILIYFSTI